MNQDGLSGMKTGMAREMNARKRRPADGIRRTRREKWKDVPGGLFGFEGGAKRSERVPVKIRAIVDVSAIIETCVEGRPAGGSRSGL